MLSEELGGYYVDLYDFAYGRLEVRWKGQVLSYRIFDKDQRVSHAAIVENKRLGHALSIIKAHQDLKYAPKVKTNSEKNGYRKRTKNRSGGNDFPQPLEIARASDSHITHRTTTPAFQLCTSPDI